MKTLFAKVVSTFKNEDIKEFALYCMENLPEYFWNIPASTSGKYHPVTDLGEGGLVRHSLMTYKVLADLFEIANFCPNNTMKESLLFAALFHDCCKCGTENTSTENTLHEHPLLAAGFIADRFMEFSEKHSTHFYIENIVNSISCHMGKWNISKYSKTILPIPVEQDEKIVHQADYIASRKYCLFDENFFNSL